MGSEMAAIRMQSSSTSGSGRMGLRGFERRANSKLLEVPALRCARVQARRSVACGAAAAPPSTLLTLHVDQTTINFPLKPEKGRDLQAGVRQLLQTFAAKQSAERPQRWKSMEFRVKGNPELQEVDYFEVFCNPNAAANAFDARVLITLKSREGVRITTEGRLSSLKEDVDAFMAQNS